MYGPSLVFKVIELNVGHHQKFKDKWSMIYGTGDQSRPITQKGNTEDAKTQNDSF